MARLEKCIRFAGAIIWLITSILRTIEGDEASLAEETKIERPDIEPPTAACYDEEILASPDRDGVLLGDVNEDIQVHSLRSQKLISCGCTGYENDFKRCNFSYLCDPSKPHCHDCLTAPSHHPPKTPSVKILLWNSHFDDIGLYRNELVNDQCPVKCEFITSRRRIHEADALLFSIIYSTDFPPPHTKTPNQLYIAHCMESVGSYFGRNLRDTEFMNRFDLWVTYLRDYRPPPVQYREAALNRKNLWMSYAPIGLWQNSVDGRLPPIEMSQYAIKDVAPVVWIASNCKVERRNNYVQELMKHISVDSYGQCLHNKDFPKEGSGRHDNSGPQRKTELLGKYRFTLAFENSWNEDYVTEKFFQPLLAGSVPVVMGAPNVATFAPTPGSYIDVKDFASPQALANYLHRLVADDKLYSEFHQWRTTPEEWNQSFSDLMHRTYHSMPCRICVEVAERNNRRREGEKSQLGI